MRWLRALAAAILSALLPGAGHALIRDWLRALLFAGLYFAALAIFLPAPAELAAVDSVAEGTALLSAEIGTVGQFVLSFVMVFAAVDAAIRALGFPPGPNGPDAADGPACPECGRELDEDLAFCHWCTTRLERPETEDAAPEEEEPIHS